MTYPLSSPVSPGDTTLASQYNDLRCDALFLGGEEGSCASLAELLTNYSSEIRLSANGAALSLEPCALMIGSAPALAAQQLTRTLSAEEFPSRGMLSIVVEKEPLGSGMRLNVVNGPIEAGCRLIGSCYWDPAVPAVSSVQGLNAFDAEELLADCAAGRLTLQELNPTPTSDINSASVLYFVPYRGRRISLYRQELGWRPVCFSRLNIALAGLSASCCYDVFIRLNGSGQPELTLTPWMDLASRIVPIQWLDGVPVSAESAELRYLGTIGLSDTGVTRDTLNDRLIWNFNHPLARPLRKLCSVAQNTNAVSGAWVPYAQDVSLAVRMVLGMNTAQAELFGMGVLTALTANSSTLGIGIDINLSEPLMNVNAADLSAAEYKTGALHTRLQNRAANRMLGCHTYHLITYTVNDSHTFGGTNQAQNSIGLSGWVMA